MGSLGSRESELGQDRTFTGEVAPPDAGLRDAFPAWKRPRLIQRRAWRHICATFALSAWITAAAIGMPKEEPTLEQLKASVSTAKPGDKAKLCVQIAERQLDESDRLYAASNYEKAQAALMDVVTYAELARDYAIQSHKHEKQTEIAAREMTRKLNEILHSLGRDDQPPLEDAINRLERVRDDLQSAMFKKGAP